MTEVRQHQEGEVEVVVNCVLVDYRGDSESRGRIVHAILEWAEEHPEEWNELQERCQQRHAVPA
ncbi:hypothetical protein FKB36_07300 [Methanoculleus sp. Afa-1]|uniref:Uncharacterized protein n=1 Tax=Methanoculleus formosensis TaxID=2590886 RepID=A0A9E5DE35_9EURY|nr:hypothetical protein [Methanoculleus sp. Afa-1]MCT8337304.1 hypothetical protein [Methanoculleus sp. Afa-1]